MPFIGRDWRSPGEAWVKTETLGWQRMKIIESQLHPSYHQPNPACSWPPRSEFGQHMATHCKEHDRSSSDRKPNNFRDSFSSESSSSDCGSRGGSVSPSPTSSPEKNMHHIYPITISSPYGKYSCCAHNVDQTTSPIMKHTAYYESRFNDNKSLGGLQNAQTALSRSLSRESVLVDTTNKGQTILRHNSSVPDFQTRESAPSSAGSDHIIEQDGSHCASHIIDNIENNRPGSVEFNTPVLLKNGCKLEDSELTGPGGDYDKEQTPKHTSRSSKQDIHHSNATCRCLQQHLDVKSIYQSKEPYVKSAPHCRISVRTREVAMYNTISEAFYRLDFCNAIHDIRRFNYICKLLHLLITQNLTSLSGCATKVLFTMLEQVAWEVSSNKRNIHVLKNLLNELKQMIQKYYCWGRPIGSSLLWQQHFDTIERISQIVEGIELTPPKSDQSQINFNNLPVEMVREILLRLNDYRDLVNSAQASPVMRTMIDNQYIWRQLCKYHFTDQQLKLALNSSSCGMFTKTPKNTVRNFKYAKTSSADGRTSFRNPVAHKTKSNATARHQTEQISGRQRDDKGKDAGSSSYVTRAISIFDKEHQSTAARLDRDNGIKETRKSLQRTKSKDHEKDQSEKQRPSNVNQPSHEIDWERVFHQLRK